MTEKSIGGLHLVSKGQQLSIETKDGVEEPVVLDSQEIIELAAWLVSLNETEFNQRESFRIRLWSGIAVHVSVSQLGQPSIVSLVDLSMTGMLIDLPEKSTLDVEVGSVVESSIQFEGETAHFSASIERKVGPRLALRLTGSANQSEVDPFPEFSKIVMAIQRRWAARFRNS